MTSYFGNTTSRIGKPSGTLHTGQAAIENALSNRRTRIKVARKSVFECHLPPVGRQMAIKNSVSNDFYLRSSIV